MIRAAMSHFIQHTCPRESNFSDSFQLFLLTTNYLKLLDSVAAAPGTVSRSSDLQSDPYKLV